MVGDGTRLLSGRSGNRLTSSILVPSAKKYLGSYTVGVAGLAVNQMPLGSGGSTPSLPT